MKLNYRHLLAAAMVLAVTNAQAGGIWLSENGKAGMGAAGQGASAGE